MGYEDTENHCIPFIIKNLHLHRLKYSSSGRAALPLFVGVNGMQGVGKTTLVSTLSNKLSSPPYLVRTLTLSIDDLYLPRSQQALLASSYSTNPLIQHRGQASTHDLPLALSLFSSLGSGQQTVIPSYDKSAHAGKGDRVPEVEWKRVEPGEVEVVIFEGWCIGFQALNGDELMQKWKEAVAQREMGLYKGRLGWNHFEDVEFVNDAWRRYEGLWSQLDILIHIHAEDPLYVYEWRLEQEASLRKTKDAGMTDEQVIEFVNGYYPSYELYTDPLRLGLFPGEKGRQLELLVGKNRKVKMAVEV